MEHIEKIIIGWMAIQGLGVVGLIWRFINLFFDVRDLKIKVSSLEDSVKCFEPATDIDRKFNKVEERETKVENRFEEIAKKQQEMLINQTLQQSSLDQIKATLNTLTNQLLSKKMDSNN